MRTKLYILACPKTLKIRYIGITTEKYLCKRLGGHRYDSINRNGKAHRHRWIKSVYEQGLKPIIRKIAEFDSWEEARDAELCMIRKYKARHALTNTDDEGRFTPTGKKSARVYLTKPVYLYNSDGEFVKEYPSVQSLCDEMSIERKTVKKILSRKKRFGKNIKYKFQLTRQKFDSVPPILNLGSRESTQPPE